MLKKTKCKIQIRKATQKDISQITNLKVKLADYHHNLDSYYKTGNKIKNIFKRNLKKQINSRNAFVVVAENEGKIMGYFIGLIEKSNPFVVSKKIGTISDAYVSPDFRKFGIGNKLFKELVKWFKSKNITYIEINPSANNKIGISAWKKYGFKEYILKMRRKI